MMTVMYYNEGASSDRAASKKSAQTRCSRKRPGHLRVLSRECAPSCSEVGRGGRQCVRYDRTLERFLASSLRSAPSVAKCSSRNRHQLGPGGPQDRLGQKSCSSPSRTRSRVLSPPP